MGRFESFMMTAIDKVVSGNAEAPFVESLQQNFQYIDAVNPYGISRDDLHPAIVKRGHELATSDY